MERGGTEGSAATENEGCNLFVGCAIRPGELKEFLALGHPNMLGLAGQFEGFFFMNLDFVRNDVFRLLDVFGSQELLGACAARSALPMVVPLDVDGHGDLPLF